MKIYLKVEFGIVDDADITDGLEQAKRRDKKVFITDIASDCSCI